MGKRAAISVIAVLIAVSLFMPMFAQDSDALVPADYYINIPGTEAPEAPIDVVLKNGESQSFTLYIVNNSAQFLDVGFSHTCDSSDVSIDGVPESFLLEPDGSKGCLASAILVVSAKTVSDSRDSVKIDITVTLTDVSDKHSTVEEHVVFDVKLVSSYSSSDMYNKFFGVIPNNLPGVLGDPIVTGVVTIIGGLVITILVCLFMINRLVDLVDRKTSKDGAKSFKKGFLVLLVIQILIFSMSGFLKIIGASASLIHDADIAVYFFSVIVITVLGWNIYIFAVKSLFNGLEEKNPDTFWDSSLIPLFNMIGTIVFIVLGISFILVPFNIDLGEILLSAGIVSLGVTLGAQNVLSQFFSGLVILITRPFKEGDYLNINDKVYIVRKVRVMYTEFKNRGRDEIVTMPNNVVSSATIRNLSKEDEYCRQSVYFTVAYGTDLDKAQQVILDAVKDYPLIVSDEKHRPPYTGIADFESSGISIRLGFYTKNYKVTGLAAAQVRALVYNAFRENGIEIPYNRVQIDILSDTSERE